MILKRRVPLFIALIMICLTMTIGTIHPAGATIRTGTLISNLNLRQAPTTDAPVITLLDKAAKVTIIAEQENWFQVIVENDNFGYKGWISAEFVENLKDAESPDQAAVTSLSQSAAPPTPAAPKSEPPATEPEPASIAPPAKTEPVERVIIKEAKLPAAFYTSIDKLDKLSKELANWETKEYVVTEEVVDPPARPASKISIIFAILILVCLVLLFCFTTLQFAKITRLVQTQLNSIKGNIDEIKAVVKTEGGNGAGCLKKDAMVEANFVIRNRAYGGFIHNISDGGAFIESRESFSMNDKVTLTYQDPQTRKHVKQTGRIVRIDPKGIGVQFNL